MKLRRLKFDKIKCVVLNDGDDYNVLSGKKLIGRISKETFTGQYRGTFYILPIASIYAETLRGIKTKVRDALECEMRRAQLTLDTIAE